MSTQTTNYGLVKPDVTEFYDVNIMNDNLDVIDTTLKSKADQTEVDSLKKSVSDGKTTVANAITGQGVTTATDATFATMATNIATVGTNKYNAGVSATKIGTATAAQVLSGYTFTNASTVGATGTMSSKSAATYTPGDSAQTIAAGQYLSGVQTISAVPTETKTTTAGTSATTVSRTSGKYMTSVTVNPTPSQTKSVTMTSSPMTITPDAGKLLSSVTVSANLGKRYASGSGFTTSATVKNITYWYLLGSNTTTNTSVYPPIVNTGISWKPTFFKASFKYESFSVITVMNAYTKYCYTETTDGSGNIMGGYSATSCTCFYDGTIPLNIGIVYMPLTINPTYITNFTWEAWE